MPDMQNDVSLEEIDAVVPSVSLGRMPQQAHVLNLQDDWTGKSSSAERRRLQNRLNQRAYSESLCLQEVT